MKVIVVGGGASGMMAAIMAARLGHDVVLVEKNEKLGKKVYITGKGRCNITNACDTEELFNNVISNKKFLYSAFYGYTNDWTMNFFRDLGLKIKIERGNRVFPESDRSSDVILTLKNELRSLGVDIWYNNVLKDVIVSGDSVQGIELKSGERIYADRVILALGGKSYSSTGSTGDGVIIAKKLGIATSEYEPSLVPFETSDYCIDFLQGLSLKNVKLTILVNDKKRYEDQGEMLFTHFGISGPLVLSASCLIKEKEYHENVKAIIDLKPALDDKQLDERILRDFEEQKNKQFRNSLGKLLPTKLIPVIVELSDIDPYKKVNEINREERHRLVYLVKHFELNVTRNRGFNEAIVSRGGISVKEINPATMESKKIKGLYFAGEMIDLDAYTGGYNLQIAWSTGALAGVSLE